MKVYISLPISGRKMEEAKQEADLVKAALSRKGYKVVSPFDVYAGKDPKYEDFICSDLRAMLDCDAVYFCPGWGLSTGCSIEYDVVRHINRKRVREGHKTIKLIYGSSMNRSGF